MLEPAGEQRGKTKWWWLRPLFIGLFFATLTILLSFAAGWTGWFALAVPAVIVFSLVFVEMLQEFFSPSTWRSLLTLLLSSFLIGLAVLGMAWIAGISAPLLGIFGGTAFLATFLLTKLTEHLTQHRWWKAPLLSLFVLTASAILLFSPLGFLPTLLPIITPPTTGLLSAAKAAILISGFDIFLASVILIFVVGVALLVLYKRHNIQQLETFKSTLEFPKPEPPSSPNSRRSSVSRMLNDLPQEGVSLKEDEVNLKTYPTIKAKSDQQSDILLGDLDGNFLKLIYCLVQEGFLQLSENDSEAIEKYQKLVDIHEAVVKGGQQLRFLNAFNDISKILTGITKNTAYKDFPSDFHSYFQLSPELYGAYIQAFRIEEGKSESTEPLTAENAKILLKAIQEHEQTLNTNKEIREKIKSNFKDFHDILAASTLKQDRTRMLTLIGDETADRCGNDEFMIEVLDKLNGTLNTKDGAEEKAPSAPKSIPYEILFSNHGAWFMEFLETGVYNPNILLGNQGLSLYNVISAHNDSKQEFGPWREKWAEKIERSYKPRLKLFSYKFKDHEDETQQHIIVESHAPVAFETYPLVAELMGVEYSDVPPKALAESIDRINNAFQKNYVQTGKTHELLGMHTLLLRLYSSEPIQGKPLIRYKIEAGKAIPHDTEQIPFDDKEIKRIAKWAGVKMDDNKPVDEALIKQINAAFQQQNAAYWQHKFHVASSVDVTIWNRFGKKNSTGICVPLKRTPRDLKPGISAHQYTSRYGHTEGPHSLDSTLGKTLAHNIGPLKILSVDANKFDNPETLASKPKAEAKIAAQTVVTSNSAPDIVVTPVVVEAANRKGNEANQAPENQRAMNR